MHAVGATALQIDSTMVALPQDQRFSLNVSWLLDTRKDIIEDKVSIYFLECKGLSIDDVGEGVEGHRISGDSTGSWL